MKSGSHQAGFTIFETLIVLAVSAAMLLAAIVLIGGRQRTTEFSQGIRLFQSQLQQTVNEVSSGYYANNGTIRCQAGSGGPIITAGSTDTQGTNNGCIFFGKAIQFGVRGTDPEQFNIYTMVGLQGTEESTNPSLTAIRPVLIARSNAAGSTNVPDVFEEKKMPFGLKVSKLYYGTNQNDGSKQIGAVAFGSSVGAFGGGDVSRQIQVLAVPPFGGNGLDKTKEAGVADINSGLTSSIVNPADGVRMCVVSGGSTQSGIITIGGPNGASSVSLTIKNSEDCS